MDQHSGAGQERGEKKSDEVSRLLNVPFLSSVMDCKSQECNVAVSVRPHLF